MKFSNLRIRYKPATPAASAASKAGPPLAAKPNEAGSQTPAASAASAIRFFGYVTYDGPARLVPECASYANVLMDVSWLKKSTEVLDAARAAKLPVILAFLGKDRDGIEDRLASVVAKYRDCVTGVSWGGACRAGYSTGQVAEFGRFLRQKLPGVQFWTSFTDDRWAQEQHFDIPSEVDVIYLGELGDGTPQAVSAKTDVFLRNWRAKAKGRPIVLGWHAQQGNNAGLVPTCSRGTFLACVEAAKKHQLTGVLFSPYGSVSSTIGIETRPDLVQEIRQCAEELGIVAQRAQQR